MRGLLGHLVAALAGATLGYVVRGVVEPGPPSSRAESPRGTNLDVTARAPPDSLRRAIEELLPRELPRGTGVIRGRVVDTAGKPLSGVRVRAYRVHGGNFDGHPQGRGPEEIEAAVRRYVHWWCTQAAPVAEWVTDGTGSFALEELVDSAYFVHAWRDGFEIRRGGDEPGIGTVDVGERLELVAVRLVDVHVDVLLSNGDRPQKAMIDCSGDRSSAIADWSPSDSTLQFVPGKYRLRATVWLDGDTPVESEPVELTISESDPPRSVCLRVVQPGLYGTIGLGTNDRSHRWDLHALRWDRTTPPSDDTVRQSGVHLTVLDRRYSFQGLAPGPYVVGIGREDGPLILVKTVQLGASSARCDFSIEDVEPGRLVHVRVVGPDGSAVGDARLSGLQIDPFRPWEASNVICEQEDGGWCVVHPRDVETGTIHCVQAVSERLGTTQALYRFGETQRVELRFLPPASLTVAISNPDPKGKLWVALRPIPATFRGTLPSSHEGNSNGEFEVSALQPGEHELLVLVRVERFDSVIAARTRLSLAPDRNRATVRLPPSHELVVTGLPPDAPVFLEPQPSMRWKSLDVRANASGEIRVEALPEGRYTLETAGGRMIVRLTGPVHAPFAISACDALDVFVRDGEREWERLGLKNGDLIVGLDGSRFRDPRDMATRWSASLKSPACTLLVRRGEETLELPMSTPALVDAIRRGLGSIEPTRQ